MALVPVHGVALSFPDFDCLFNPTFVFILLRAYDLALFPSYHMIAIHNVDLATLNRRVHRRRLELQQSHYSSVDKRSSGS